MVKQVYDPNNTGFVDMDIVKTFFKASDVEQGGAFGSPALWSYGRISMKKFDLPLSGFKAS